DAELVDVAIFVGQLSTDAGRGEVGDLGPQRVAREVHVQRAGHEELAVADTEQVRRAEMAFRAQVVVDLDGQPRHTRQRASALGYCRDVRDREWAGRGCRNGRAGTDRG